MLARLTTILLALALPASCRHEEKFPTLGTKIVSPIDVASSVDGKYFYVLNADMDRTYNKGSVLVLDRDGQRIGAVDIPRMGRSMTVSGNDMIVTIDYQDLEAGAEVLLFSLADPAKPKLEKRFPVSCSPFSADARAGYQYFAVSCADGAIYVGVFKENRGESTLHRVRRYSTIPRRALYIDPKRNLLLGFVTDPTKGWIDQVYKDAGTFDDNANPTVAAANEVPDDFENSRRVLTSQGERQIYQFFVLDLEAEAAQGFPYRQQPDPAYKKELRWLYFSLSNFDGTPDGDDAGLDPSFKYYRTNFWAARPDPDDSNSFFLSHRGLPPSSGVTGSPHSNQIVKVTFVDDLRPKPDNADGTPNVPKTGEVLSFERVYGFKGDEVTKFSYPGDFRVARVNGQKLLLVNHFRDLVNWVRGDVRFSLTAASLDDGNLWFAQTPASQTQSPDLSWYQVALNDDGRALSCSFYGNAVMLLDVTPGIGITLIKRIP